jgi:putative transposase
MHCASLSLVRPVISARTLSAWHSAIRCWTRKFGQVFVSNLRRARPTPTGCWHLDELVVKAGGKRMWSWRAVNDEGDVLDVLLQKRRN